MVQPRSASSLIGSTMQGASSGSGAGPYGAVLGAAAGLMAGGLMMRNSRHAAREQREALEQSRRRELATMAAQAQGIMQGRVNPALGMRTAGQIISQHAQQTNPAYAAEYRGITERARQERRQLAGGMLQSASSALAQGIASSRGRSADTAVEDATSPSTFAVTEETRTPIGPGNVAPAPIAPPPQIAETVIDPTQPRPGVSAPGVKELANFEPTGDTVMQQNEAALERFAQEQQTARLQGLAEQAEAEASITEAEARRVEAERRAEEAVRGADTEGLSNAVATGEAQARAMGTVRRSAASRRPPRTTPRTTPEATTAPAPAPSQAEQAAEQQFDVEQMAPERRTSAREMFNMAARSAAAGDYEGALAIFEAIARFAPHPRVLARIEETRQAQAAASRSQ